MNDPLLGVAQRASRATDAAVGLLCIATVAGPLALGATGPWPRFGLEALMAVSAALWVLFGRNSIRGRALPIVIAGIFLLQLVPLPDGVLMTLSPLSAGRWKVAREGLPHGWAPR